MKKTVAAVFPFVWLLLAVLVLPFFAAIFTDLDLIASTREVFGYNSIFLIEAGAILLFVLVVLITYLYERWYFVTYFYDLTDDHIVIKKGPITPQEITIPYERVQDVYVDQDLWDRIFNLYDVHLSSATVSSGMQAHIDGVEKASADGLRGILLSEITKRMKKR